MYSPVSVGSVPGAGLAPMAVLPEYQRQGVGSERITVGKQRLGFVPASSRAIRCEWDVPDNVFMVLVLDETKMHGVSGVAKYRQEFSTVT